MCGIAGFFCRSNIPENRINQTLELMKNRGPDHQDAKVFINHSSSRTVGLLHSRLSIIDLDPRSNQPFTIGNLSIVYNGEIYNYRDLKKDLIRNGYNFQTDSDSEVIIKLFDFEGKESFKKLSGIFAISLYDKKNNKLYLIRDIVGVKPLYYYYDDIKKNFFFSSLINPLLLSIKEKKNK